MREYQKQTGIAKESGKWLSMDFLNAKKNYETFRDIFADQTTVFQNTIEQDQKNILETKKLYKEYEDEITQPIGDGKGLDGYFKGTKDAWEDLFQTARSNYREILKILSTTPKTDITGTLLNEQADYYKSVAELQQEAYVREFGFKEKQKELQRNYINKVLEINAETTISEDKKRKKIKAAGEQLEIDLQNIDDKIWANDKTLTSSLELLWLNHFNNRKKIQLEYERSIRQSVNDRNIQNAKQVVADQERAAKITDKNEELFSNFVENAKTGRQFKNAKKRLKLTWQEQIDNLYITTKSKEAQLDRKSTRLNSSH